MKPLNEYIGTGLTRNGNWTYLISYNEETGRGVNWRNKNIQVLEFNPIINTGRWVHYKDGNRTMCGYPLNNSVQLVEYRKSTTTDKNKVTCKRCIELLKIE